MNNNEDFPNKNFDLRKTMSKAKRTSIIRTILISLSVSIVVFTAFFWIGNYVLNKKIEKELSLDAMWYSVYGANRELQGTTIDHSLLSATVKSKFVKNVGDVPIDWVPLEKEFSIIGSSNLITSEGVSGTGDVEDERIQMYFNGERSIEFFHPKVTSKLVDDRELVNSLDEDKVLELALSFDKGYSLEEIENTFNKNLSWFWVDSYSQDRLEEFKTFKKETGKDLPIIGDETVGFKYTGDASNQNGATLFIDYLNTLKEDGKYEEIASRIVDDLTDNSKKELTPEQLSIIGVVITGTPDQLEVYDDVPFVRAATLGVTTDRY